MRPLSEFPKAELARIRGVLCDIDDTLTTDGRLTAAAYAALERLQRAGMRVVPITGRPAGWCDHIARMWPVDAVVGENGAFYFRYDHAQRLMQRCFVDDADTRARMLRHRCRRVQRRIRFCGRFAQRYADVRLLPACGRRGQYPGFRRTPRRRARLRHTSGKRRGVLRVGGFPARFALIQP